MRTRVTSGHGGGVACLAIATLALAACGTPPPDPKLAKYEAARQVVAAHIAALDELDFDIFSHQKWDQLGRTHAKDVLVHWPDGHLTKGVEKYVEGLKAMFVYAPNTRIELHPVRIGQGEWTSVVGIMEGRFTQPIPTGNGQAIPPTRQPFKLTICRVGHWKDGAIDEEYLFWDNQTFMRQLGLLK